MVRDNTDSILLASGGLDSTTLAYDLIEKGVRFRPVFIDYGQHCAKTELATLLAVLPANMIDLVEVLTISDIYKESQSRLIREADLWTHSITRNDLHLPYRNLVLLASGAAYAQSKKCSSLYVAFISSNISSGTDCSIEFLSTLTSLLTGYGMVELKLPFLHMTKHEVAVLGIALGAPIGATFSCQASSRIPCGACSNCVDRLEALKQISQ